MGIDYSEVFKYLKGGRGAFIFGLFTNLYVWIAIPAITITYIFYNELDKLGIIEGFHHNLINITSTIEEVTTRCVPQILDFNEFLHCFGF